jgi:hypothetical protein
MKKVFVFVLMSFATFIATAQGNLFVGGTGSVSYVDNFTFVLEPQVGYEITDRWAIGSGLGVLVLSDKDYAMVGGIADPFIRVCVAQ